MGGGDQHEDEEKFNKMVNLDMEEQRKNIKVKVTIMSYYKTLYRKMTLLKESRWRRRKGERRRNEIYYVNIAEKYLIFTNPLHIISS